MASTKQVSQLDETIRKHPAKISKVHRFSDLDDAEKGLLKTASDETYAIETDETIFYVQGGGQPTDVGTMSASGKSGETIFHVEAVRYGGDGRILHFGTFKTGSLSTGDLVEQNIDGERRNINSRVHTGGHLIALSVRRLAATTPGLDVVELKASHYPDASFVEFRGIIDSKFKDSIQEQATTFVRDALPIKVDFYKPEELSAHNVILAEGMPIIAGPDGNVRVVDIVGAGAYPCGGTHVADSSYVGNLVVKGIKRQKGISKISYTIQS